MKILLEFTPSGYIKKTIDVDTVWLSLYGEAGIQNPDDASFLKWADVFCFVYVLKTAYDMLCELALYGFNEYFSCKTGEGFGATNFSWTASLFLDLMLENNYE